MTTPPFNHNWEKQLHEKLRQLPDIEAPQSLIPDVMAAIRARQEAIVAWYRRPATTWPASLQFALGLTAMAVFVLAVFGIQQLAQGTPAAEVTGPFAAFSAKVGSIWSIIQTLVDALVVVLRNALSPLLLGVVAAACFSYLALLGIGGALWRTVMHRQPY
jgi:hypothetical protein